MRPTQNLTRPPTSASVVRGRVIANRRTSATVTTPRMTPPTSRGKFMTGCQPARNDDPALATIRCSALTWLREQPRHARRGGLGSLESRPRRPHHLDIATDIEIAAPVLELPDRNHDVGAAGVEAAPNVVNLGSHRAERAAGRYVRGRGQWAALDVQPGPVAENHQPVATRRCDAPQQRHL